MRIIAGTFRSRTLVAPKGTATRPTMDRARESLFNVLTNVMDIGGAWVLDLYAGSGALAFEALSRGAARATLVDRDRKAIGAIKTNACSLGVEDRVSIRQQDAHTFLERRGDETFNLIFADPPYEEKELAKLEGLIFEAGWLAPRGHCIIEHHFDTTLEPVGGAHTVRELKAGEALFTIFTYLPQIT
ncbi:MAG TPA: 16S rRNA (guanine(966)-N(2))-methyltransferase RsmD [Candidatus Kapabacteria bacterium]|nr:16S rRNA (guanine(966)-N(2))-methyltransferase RsmD [Candidatus Kapabacteria bacterium]